jgi:hypothetical protein
MLDLANPAAGPLPARPVLRPPAEFTAGALLHALGAQPGLPLIFEYEGRDIRAGYHVTEVKAGQFSSLDCGKNPESWRETVIQLWDVDEGERTHMTAGKFVAILRKVAEKVEFDAQARLTFEVSDGRGAMQLFAAGEVAPGEDAVRVSLARRPASCKPRDRWLEDERAGAGNASGCGCV